VALATRAELRVEISPGYSCTRHVMALHFITFGTIATALAFLRSPSLAELATVPLAFLFANTVEYFVHRYPMHHRWPLLGFLFARHTVGHHAYFRRDSMLVDDARDVRFVLFPPLACLSAIAFAGTIGALLAVTITRNTGLLFLTTASFYYLLYEWFHASFHLAPVERLRWIPILGKAARRHGIHHDPSRMTDVNFNITVGLFDRLLGTAVDT